MADISARLRARVQAEYPHHASLVLEKLRRLDPLVVASRQDPERLYAAVVQVARGRLDFLDRALELARVDWRDLLVAAELAEDDWPVRLSGWLDPSSSPLRED